MVIFPEGGFLRKRREVSQRFAKKNDLPVLQHVTLPRVGAMKAIVDVLLPTNSSANNNLSKPVNGSLQPIEGKYLKNFVDVKRNNFFRFGYVIMSLNGNCVVFVVHRKHLFLAI